MFSIQLMNYIVDPDDSSSANFEIISIPYSKDKVKEDIIKIKNNAYLFIKIIKILLYPKKKISINKK
ncbi:MAG: hypothetical protein V2B14_03560 [bacterium]